MNERVLAVSIASLDRFLDNLWMERGLADNTLKAYRSDLGKFAEWLAERDLDDILRTVDHLNLTTHWAQSRASEDDLERITDTLLLAMHDLRGVLVRKKAERLATPETEAAR